MPPLCHVPIVLFYTIFTKCVLNSSILSSNFLFLFSQARYDGKLLRPMSAPVRRIISLMDNEEPVFGKTHQHFDPQLKDVYPHKGLRLFHLFIAFLFLFLFLRRFQIPQRAYLPHRFKKGDVTFLRNFVKKALQGHKIRKENKKRICFLQQAEINT